MIQIQINGTTMQIGQPLPTSVDTLVIVHQVHPMMPPQLVTVEQAVVIKAWLRELINKCTNEYIVYNGTLIKTTELIAENK